MSLGMTVAGAVYLFVFGPLLNAHSRLLTAARDRGELAAHVHAFDGLLARAAVAILGGGALACALLTVFAPRWSAVVAASVAFAVAQGAALFHNAYAASWRRRRAVASFQAADGLLRAALAGAAVALFGKSGAIALSGYAGASVLLFLWQRRAAFRIDDALAAARAAAPGPGRPVLDEALRYGGPYVLNGGLTSVAQYADRWALLGLLGPAEVGVYAALAQVGVAPTAMAAGVVNGYLVPLAFERAGALGDPARVRSALRLVALGAAATAALLSTYVLVCWFVGEPLLRLLARPDFAEHHRLLWIFAVAGTALAVGQTLLVVGQVLRRTASGLVPWAVNAAATVVLSLWLGSRFGLPGVVWALLLSNASHALTSALVGRWLVATRS